MELASPPMQLGLPTLERPFGLSLWPVFSSLYRALTGAVPEEFRFVPGQTPMATILETTFALASYYFVVFAGRHLMQSHKPFQLQLPFKVHNFVLSLTSGVLLLLFLEQLIPTIWNKGIFFSICNHAGGWTDELVVLYYLNYLMKYAELLDTVFLVVKKKPLTFLHTYHHGATVLLCFTQLIGNTAVSWVPITLNLMVHVVMYWYYFQAARGIKIWWKKYITILQIIQFVIDLGFIYFASYTYFSAKYFPSMPTAGLCAGEEFAAVAGMGILSSYLVLFIAFFISTYKQTANDRVAKATLLDAENQRCSEAKSMTTTKTTTLGDEKAQ